VVAKGLTVFNAKDVIKIGATSNRTLVVTQDLTANQRYPELPSVFATAEMIFAMECAAADAIKDILPAGFVSVGTHVNVEHLAATPVGETIIAVARVLGIEDKIVSFTVEARDQHALIGTGEHKRGIVNLERFLERLDAR